MRQIFLSVSLLLVCSAATVEAQDVDTLGMERTACRDLRTAGKTAESFECLQSLWENKRAEMAPGGRINVLAQLAELYSIAGNESEAQRCFEGILSEDPHWLPNDFDMLPTSWRRPILSAYKARGFLLRSTALRNLALLDFVIVDMSPDDVDLESIGGALSNYMSAYLQETIQGANLKGDDTPIRIVSYRERSMLMDAVASGAGIAAGASVTADEVNAQTLVQAGRLQAVQGFLSGTIIRGLDGKIEIAMRLLSVETGEILCPVTTRGKAKDLFPKIQDSLRKWVECALDGVELDDDSGASDLGPVAKGVLALVRYDEAMQLAEAEQFGPALESARLALNYSPESADIARFITALESQEARLDLVENLSLPGVSLDQ